MARMIRSIGRRVTSVLALGVLALAATVAPPGARAAALQALSEVSPDASGVTTLTLTVDGARVDVPGAVAFSTRAYHHNGVAALQGPTIRLQAGGTLRLTLVNNLLDDSAVDASRAHNTWRHVNTTNVHTHGLHVDPAIDSIFRHASPGGGTLVYDMPIPADHAPGMHWYHSHTHGSSTLHIMGGLVGAMYVNAQARDNIPAQLSGMTTHLLVMQFLNFASETGNNGGVTQDCDRNANDFDPFKSYSFAELESEHGSTLASNPTYAVTGRSFYTINGQYQPTLTLAPGEQRLLQMVYAAGTNIPRLTATGGCTMTVVAMDGVYVAQPRVQSFLQFNVAMRVEFVLECPNSGTFALQVNNGGNGASTTVVELSVTGTAVSSTALASTLLSGITKPAYLNDLSTMTSPDTTNQVRVGATGTCMWGLGMGSSCEGNGPTVNNNCPVEAFTGSKGTSSTSGYAFSMKVGQTSEWKVIGGGGNMPHPLHIHVNHYQITSFTGNGAFDDWMTVGDWRDTVPMLSGSLTIRFIADALSGETIVHCHELAHEDRGLMGSFLIQPADTTTAAATTTTAASTATTTSAAASTTAAASSGATTTAAAGAATTGATTAAATAGTTTAAAAGAVTPVPPTTTSTGSTTTESPLTTEDPLNGSAAVASLYAALVALGVTLAL